MAARVRGFILMKKFFSFFNLLTVLFLAALPAFCAPQTDVYIGITSVGDKRLPAIGMPPFNFSGDKAQEAAVEVRDVMRGDLRFARYFGGRSRF